MESMAAVGLSRNSLVKAVGLVIMKEQIVIVQLREVSWNGLSDSDLSNLNVWTFEVLILFSIWQPFRLNIYQNVNSTCSAISSSPDFSRSSNDSNLKMVIVYRVRKYFCSDIYQRGHAVFHYWFYLGRRITRRTLVSDSRNMNPSSYSASLKGWVVRI